MKPTTAPRTSESADPAVGQLRRIRLFESLSDRQLIEIADRIKVIRYKKRTEILARTDKNTDVFLVIDGCLQVKNYSYGGREVIYLEIYPGDIFGEFSAIDGSPRSASVVATQDSVVGRMSSSSFLQLLRGDFDVTFRLCRILVSKLRNMTERMFEVSALTLQDRLRAELARLAEGGVAEGPTIVIQPAPTHYDIAARIGSHREAVTRELNRLESLGHISLKRRQITILNASFLKART